MTTDSTLPSLATRLVRSLPSVASDAQLWVHVVDAHLVRVQCIGRGAPVFLVSSDGEVLEYRVPAVNHEDALREFRLGRRFPMPAERLRAAGFTPG